MWRGCRVVAAGLLNCQAAAASLAATPQPEHPATSQPAITPAPQDAGLRLLDVPFVPQSDALCGGAALAMVLRFWGETGLHAEHFAAIAGPGAAGIRAADLVQAVRARGWRALEFRGGLTEARLQLAAGRPVVALVRERGASNHYIVLVGAAGPRVLVHDPVRGPFRVVSGVQLQQAWADAGNWGLLILPPAAGGADSLAATHAPSVSSRADGEAMPDTSTGGCALLVDRGACLARDGALAAAAEVLSAAVTVCADTPAPLVELAGVRFRQNRWHDAQVLAERAARLQPADAYTWDLLATARFMQGDAGQALQAWNRIGRPRIDLTRIDGLRHTNHRVVTQALAQPHGTLLTEASLRLARRRMARLPTAQAARIDYLPLADGTAQLDVNVRERPRWSPGGPPLGAAVHAAVKREVRVELAAPTGNGELWSARWRWWRGSPALAAGVEAPSAWSALGIWRVEALWERQLLRGPLAAVPDAGTVERRRSSAGCGQWVTADWRWDITAALERWSTRGRDAVIDFGIEHRAMQDRLLLRGGWAQAWSLTDRGPYAARNVLAAWRSSPGFGQHTLQWSCHLGASTATSGAPVLLWPGAERGPGGTAVLRAHPVYENGVLITDRLARELLHGGVETQFWPGRMRLFGLGFAAFLDVARPGLALASAPGLWQADAGAGLRLRLPARRDQLRLDVARGWRNGGVVFSAGIETGRWFED